MINKITKSILLGENFKIDPLASIQALYDIVANVRVTNIRDTNRINLAKEHLRVIKGQLRSLNERINLLEEELTLLKEEK